MVMFELRNYEYYSRRCIKCGRLSELKQFDFSNTGCLHDFSAVPGDRRRLTDTYENIWAIFENIAHPCKGDTLPYIC